MDISYNSCYFYQTDMETASDCHIHNKLR
uniref:Uncharacterized protein n=1 Tax=Arundo donax TaxID=35708 RepID=A0A0A9HNP7_ARUDO